MELYGTDFSEYQTASNIPLLGNQARFDDWYVLKANSLWLPTAHLEFVLELMHQTEGGEDGITENLGYRVAFSSLEPTIHERVAFESGPLGLGLENQDIRRQVYQEAGIPEILDYLVISICEGRFFEDINKKDDILRSGFHPYCMFLRKLARSIELKNVTSY